MEKQGTFIINCLKFSFFYKGIKWNGQTIVVVRTGLKKLVIVQFLWRGVEAIINFRVLYPSISHPVNEMCVRCLVCLKAKWLIAPILVNEETHLLSHALSLTCFYKHTHTHPHTLIHTQTYRYKYNFFEKEIAVSKKPDGTNYYFGRLEIIKNLLIRIFKTIFNTGFDRIKWKTWKIKTYFGSEKKTDWNIIIAFDCCWNAK